MPGSSVESHSAGLLRHIIDTGRDAVMVIDPDSLTITTVDSTTCRLLGYEADELIGQPLAAIECSLQDLFFWEELKTTPQFEGDRIIESEWLTKGGDSIAVEKRASSYREQDKCHWIIHAEDLTRRRHLEEEQVRLTAQLQSSFEATAEGILVVDTEGNIGNFNRRFVEMWKMPDDILASHSQTQLTEFMLASLQNRADYEAKLARITERSDIDTEDVLALSDGRYFVCSSKPQYLRDRLMGRVFSFRDITAMKQAESELMLARDAAEQASRVKSQFLSQMSHELRTPLNAIIGFAQLLEIEASGSTREQLATISRAGKHLLSVINEILDVAKIEAGRIEVERIPFSPIQILREIESLIEVQVQEKSLYFAIHYDFPLPSFINSDPTRFRQILLNLCTNAVKYTDGGSVELHVRCEGEMLKIAVVDTGIGIDAEQQKKLFSAFSQADSSTTRKYGGTGLGLYISYQLAQLLGGNIALESVPGSGSRFEFSLATGPLEGVAMLTTSTALSEAAAPSKISAQTPHLQGHVLLAEDGADNQKLVRAYLERAGVAVTIVENGIQAIEQALPGDFDLVLMDMQMPIMGGLEATSILRQAAYAKPIVALTANVMKEDVEQYLAAGCSDHLSKPIDMDRFFQMLAKYLQPASESDEGDAGQAAVENMDFYQKLAAEFIAGLGDTMQRITDAVQHGDWASAGFVAHTLKGTAGSFGYPHISELADKLNKAIKADQKDAMVGAWTQLKQAVESDLAKR
jgi:PAS domain S-box-containing protein